MNVRLALCGLVAVLLVPRPALAAANKEHLQLMAEIRMLQEQQQQLQQLIGALQDTLKTVTTKLDDQAAATRKAMADQTLATNNIGDNVRVLREKADETNVKLSSVAQEIDGLRQSIQAMPVAAPVGGGTAAVTPNTNPAPGATGAATAPDAAPPASAVPTRTAPVGVSPQKLFDNSYDDYTANRYDMAIDGFNNYIQWFPRLPQAADAQFNIGMSYYNQGKWTDALTALQSVVANYPQAPLDRLSDAYYKLGQTFEKLNQTDNAKHAYETAVQKYAGTFSATQAKQALDRLNRK